MCLVAHLWDQPFLATEILVVLSKSHCVFTLAHSVAGELDYGDDHNQAEHDAEDGSDDSSLVPGLASEISILLPSIVGHRWSQLPAARRGCLWIAVQAQRGLGIINFDTRSDRQLAGRQRIRNSCRRRTASTGLRPNTSQHVHSDRHHGTLFCLLPLLQEREATRVPSPRSCSLHGLAYFSTGNPRRVATVQNMWKWGRLP